MTCVCARASHGVVCGYVYRARLEWARFDPRRHTQPSSVCITTPASSGTLCVRTLMLNRVLIFLTAEPTAPPCRRSAGGGRPSGDGVGGDGGGGGGGGDGDGGGGGGDDGELEGDGLGEGEGGLGEGGGGEENGLSDGGSDGVGVGGVAGLGDGDSGNANLAAVLEPGPDARAAAESAGGGGGPEDARAWCRAHSAAQSKVKDAAADAKARRKGPASWRPSWHAFFLRDGGRETRTLASSSST